MLEIYNTLTRSKQLFTPIHAGKVGIYVCGMTVYDFCHLGHARVMIAFDVIVRHLRQLDYDVTYVRNITDIDDKIIKRAQLNDEAMDSLTERFITAMHEDERALGVLAPDHEPRATDSIQQIIDMVATLIESGAAYIGTNGDVFYAVNQFQGYGKLSGKRIEELRVGERVDIDNAKKDPLDFVLWKSAKPGEPAWDSPWGAGRPGWHIECSAMSTCQLGNHFDIHGGGMDLQFPHHENEIAQSEAATGEHFANYWMHNGFVRVDDEKMSKSLGNFFTVRDVLKTVRTPEVIRFFMLSSHYRSPINYSQDNLTEADAALSRLYTALRGISPSTAATTSKFREQYMIAMNDDFNTAQAIAVLFELAKELNRQRSSNPENAAELAAELIELGALLGLLQQDADQFLKLSATATHEESASNPEATLSDQDILKQIQARTQARTDKNWALADQIRDDLLEQGIILEDVAGETSWRRK